MGVCGSTSVAVGTDNEGCAVEALGRQIVICGLRSVRHPPPRGVSLRWRGRPRSELVEFKVHHECSS